MVRCGIFFSSAAEIRKPFRNNCCVSDIGMDALEQARQQFNAIELELQDRFLIVNRVMNIWEM